MGNVSSNKMRVLMLSRNDVFEVPGGDTVQMLQTKAGLEKLGVEVQLGGTQETPPFSKYDIVHIFNWQQLDCTLDLMKLNSHNATPIVLSTIFWFHTGHWFDQAISTKPIWKAINRLEAVWARKFYESWQQIKFKWGTRGRRLRDLMIVPSRLLPNSKTEVIHLESVLGLKGKLQSRCTIVPNGVARELFDPLPTPDQTFQRQYGIQEFVLQVARIQSAKNQLGLIQALFDVPNPIVFVGQTSQYEPDYVARCYNLAKKRGNVYFLGPRSPAELAGIYVLAAVHVLPSWRETPGLVSLEAAAAGCKIVSTSIGSAHEYFSDNAWYCDPRDLGSIRQAVVGALNVPSSDRLRNIVLERYTWDIAAQKTLEAYQTRSFFRQKRESLKYFVA
jgi:glycosyltransferase involved in cell wall biosynthesis